MDIMPTLLDFASLDHPAKRLAAELLAMQDSSLRLLLPGEGGVAFNERGLGGELFGIRAYRRGDWKILKLPPPYGRGKSQLYDLSKDLGETSDVSAESPNLRADLVNR
ncbi:Arylsulfatase [Planctomycetes bacterium CA13]|uniref:Arylsulfatase n=2 Tax=Novipirellula herctigrandis TaxID=2527986 RepID=A0A5C5ZD81_9BACT|nr:Arylsulfatase [Planctomycetes bacterium CA13]